MAEPLTPDLCIIGGGSAGLELAEAARAEGKSVVLVERELLGGESLHATVPSRALAATAERAYAIRTAAPFGISGEEPRINFARVRDHLQQAIAAAALPVSWERFLALGVEVIGGEAKFIDKKTVLAGDRIVRARRFVIATGSRPLVPPIPGLDAMPFLTSRSVFELERKPNHLLILGAGRTGLELAQAWKRLGSEVTVLDKAAPLGGCDPELVEVATRLMVEEGVVLRTLAELVSVEPRGAGLAALVRQEGVESTITASHIVVATGREPALDNLDLDKAGIRRRKDDASRLQLRSDGRTTNARVYAVGDAAMGAPVGDSAAVPRVTFTDPEIAEVGLNEPAAKLLPKAGYRVCRWPFAENDRARATREIYGLGKLVTDGKGRILGAGLVGRHAGELIALFSLAIGNRMTIDQFLRFVPASPSFSELAASLAREFERQAPAKRNRSAALRRVLP